MLFKDLSPGDIFKFEVLGFKAIAIKLSSIKNGESEIVNCGTWVVGSMGDDREVEQIGNFWESPISDTIVASVGITPIM